MDIMALLNMVVLGRLAVLGVIAYYAYNNLMLVLDALLSSSGLLL